MQAAVQVLQTLRKASAVLDPTRLRILAGL